MTYNPQSVPGPILVAHLKQNWRGDTFGSFQRGMACWKKNHFVQISVSVLDVEMSPLHLCYLSCIDSYSLLWFSLAPQLARRLRLSSFGCHCLEPEFSSEAFLSTPFQVSGWRQVTWNRCSQPFALRRQGFEVLKHCITCVFKDIQSICEFDKDSRAQEWDAPDLQAAAKMTSTAVGSLVRNWVNMCQCLEIFGHFSIIMNLEACWRYAGG